MPKVSSARVPRRKPKLGQHFLADRAAAARIVEELGDLSQATVLEIGPGRGAITSLLAKGTRRLIAIELDRVLAAQLRMKFALYPNMEIIEADILAVDFDGLFAAKPGSTRPGINHAPAKVRVVGNLPYFITSDILLRLFKYRKYFDTMLLMVQREVAERLAAEPGNSEYGLLSATAQLYSKVENVFTLPPGAFAPPPKVHSSVVRLTLEPRLEALRVPENEFITFLKLSFGQKRKTLWNNLKTEYEPKQVRKAMETAGIDSNARAEELTLEQSAALFGELGKQ